MPPTVDWSRHLRCLRLIDPAYGTHRSPLFSTGLVAFDGDEPREDVELRRLTLSTDTPAIATIRQPADDVLLTDGQAYVWGRPALTPAARPVRWFDDDGLLLNPQVGPAPRPDGATVAEVDVYVGDIHTGGPGVDPCPRP